ATLSDQIDAVINEIDNAPGAPVVVGHSAACSLAWLAADARPYKVGKVVLVGGFPHAEGESYADFFDYEEGLMPFPGWDQFDDRDTADLDHAARRAMEESMTAVPKGVTKRACATPMCDAIPSRLRWCAQNSRRQRHKKSSTPATYTKSPTPRG